MPVGDFTEFNSGLDTGAAVRALCLGPDGNVYFTAASVNKVYKVTPAGVITQVVSFGAGYGPYGICSDGTNLWVACSSNNKVVKITTAGATTEYSITTGTTPRGCCYGPDGNVWIACNGNSKLAKIGTGLLGTTLGTITEYSVTSAPFMVATDGTDIFYTANAASKVGKITTAGGSNTEKATTTGSAAPLDLCLGPDGNMWVTYNASGSTKIGKFDTALSTCTEYTVNGRPAGICAAGGYLWVTEGTDNKIARVDTAGTVTEYAYPTASSSLLFIATGGDGRVWFGANRSGANSVGAMVATTATTIRVVNGLLDADDFTSSGANDAVFSAGSVTGGGLSVASAVPYRVNRPYDNHGVANLQADTNVAISVDVTVGGSSAVPTVRLQRAAASTDTYDLTVAITGGGTSRTKRNGSNQQSAAKGIASGTTKRVKLYKNGSVIGAVVDGTAIAEFTDGSPHSGPFNVALGDASGTSVFDNFDVCASNSIIVRGLGSGWTVRLYDANDQTLASATASGGVATLDCSTVPFPIVGYLRVFSDSYTTHVESWPRANAVKTSRKGWLCASDLRGGDDLTYDWFTSTAVNVIDAEAQNAYATTQVDSHNGVIVSGDTAYGLMHRAGAIYAFQGSISTNVFTLTKIDDVQDMHTTCAIVQDSSGYFSIVYGGSSGTENTKYRKSSSANDTTAWSSATDLGIAIDEGALLIDQADKLHLVGSSFYGGNARARFVYLSKTSAGAWTAAGSATVLANANRASGGSNNWEIILGDAAIGKESSGQKSIHVVAFAYEEGGAFSYYQNVFYFRSTDGGATWKKLDGTTLTLPLAQVNSTGQLTGGDHIRTGNGSVPRICVEDDGHVDVIVGQTNSSTSYDFYRGNPGSSWPASTSTLTGIGGSNHPAIEQIRGYLFVAAVKSGVLKSLYSLDNGSTWTETTLYTKTQAGALYWPKLTPISGGDFMLLFQHRRGVYANLDGNSPLSGGGRASLLMLRMAGIQVDGANRGSATAAGRSATGLEVLTDTAGRGSAAAAGRVAFGPETGTATRGSATAAGRPASDSAGGVTDTASRGAATAAGRVAIERTGSFPTWIVGPTTLESAQFGSSTLESAQFGSSTFVVEDMQPIS